MEARCAARSRQACRSPSAHRREVRGCKGYVMTPRLAASVLVVALLSACAGQRPAPAAQPAPLVHRFTDPEQWSKRFDDPARDAWQKPADVVGLMRIAPGMTVADIGAGTGYFEPYLSRAVGPNGVV